MTSRAEITTRLAKAYVKAAEQGQEGKGPRPGGRGDGVVARQCPAQAYRSGDAAAGIGSQQRKAATQAKGSEVFLRRAQGAAAGLGRLGWAVRRAHGRDAVAAPVLARAGAEVVGGNGDAAGRAGQNVALDAGAGRHRLSGDGDAGVRASVDSVAASARAGHAGIVGAAVGGESCPRTPDFCNTYVPLLLGNEVCPSTPYPCGETPTTARCRLEYP